MDELEQPAESDDATATADAPSSDDTTPLEEALAAAESAARDAIERLRTALLASDPDVAPEMVAGETAAEVEASFAVAREVVDRLREKARRDAAVAVPAGAPGRATRAPASALEKIRAGLGRM
ncbi:MAG: hypothetical protein HY875_12535 [Chloroflexi bacterium]|nr:hypothetical protein [Chloroflexota bacterium]